MPKSRKVIDNLITNDSYKITEKGVKKKVLTKYKKTSEFEKTSVKCTLFFIGLREITNDPE